MASDLAYVIKWWTFIFLIGAIFLPDVCTIFSSFFDRGYLFSKTIGIILSSYVIWLLSSFKIVPFERLSIIILLAAAAIIEYGFLKGYKKLVPVLKKYWYVFLSEELLLLAGLIFWCYVRGMQPDIYGLEKYMDFGFINSILRTRYMPPVDIWFSGKNINYYYYGHYIAAFLIKLCGIEPSIGYNIMLSTVFSLALSLSFSVGANLFHMTDNRRIKTAVAAGIISALLVTLGGNLHTIIYAVILPAAKNAGLYTGKLSSYFYAEATRYIGYNPPTNDKTIHEFPLYSFVVSDLHAHVSDIPYVLTFIAALLSYIVKEGEDKSILFLSALLLGIFYMTNTWDYLIYMTVLLFAFTYKTFKAYGFKLKNTKKIIWDMLKVVLISQAMCLPFTFYFKNMTGGIGLVSHRTPFYQLLVLWGYQLLLSLCFLMFLLFKNRGSMQDGEPHDEPNAGFLKRVSSADAYILILIVSAIGLVMIPEVVYVRDIYGATYQRANTMFKLTYQSFIIFGICSGYIIARIVSNTASRTWRTAGMLFFTVLIAMPMIYPYYAIKGYYGSIKPKEYRGLYGLNFMDNGDHDDYEAVLYLNKNVKGQPVVLEAGGDSYSDYERISMATGLPTVIGWFGHEWLWRNGPEAPTSRTDDVKEIYESADIEMTKLLLQKYSVSYVVIGDLEKQKYANLDSEKFLKLGSVVFKSGGTEIIKIGG